jgi:hypothetical protein
MFLHPKPNRYLSHRSAPDPKEKLNPMYADLLEHLFIQEMLQVLDKSIPVGGCKFGLLDVG